jgi:hypothetical protein
MEDHSNELLSRVKKESYRRRKEELREIAGEVYRFSVFLRSRNGIPDKII